MDVYEGSVDGGPLDIITQRMITFNKRSKMVVLSTPRSDGKESLIEKEYLKGDQRRFYVPCQHCDAMDIMYWESVVIDVAQYRCPHCKSMWTEDDRLASIAGGEWRATSPFPFSGHASYHMTQLSSPFVQLSTTVKRYTEGTVHAFYTQALAESYEDVEASDIDETELMRFVVKESTCEPPQAITCGVDVQGDRLEYQVVAWRGPRACVIKHGIVPITLSNNGVDTWLELKDCLRPYKPDMTFVDSSYRPDFVRDGLRDHFPSGFRDNIHDIQGMPGSSFGKVSVDDKRKRSGALAVATDELKSIQYDMIRSQEINFVESGINSQFLSQFACERLERVTSKTTGKVNVQWVKQRERNEAMDCFIYALGAKKRIEIDDPDFDRSHRTKRHDIILV